MILVGPGPGSYRLPSDFGHYESKLAKTMDAEQWKQQQAESRMSKTQNNARLAKNQPSKSIANLKEIKP